jgi:ATP-binding cassette subfamily B protein
MYRPSRRPAPGPATLPQGDWGTLRTLATLAPHLWPRGALELKVRVVTALVLLIGAKVANVYVPILYKHAIDALSTPVGVIVVPIGLIVAYGLLRSLAQAFAELRDAVFAKVGQRAIRNTALGTFRHLHALSLGFHLDRQTGGLSRAIERGVKGIEYLLSFMLFSIVPTLVEIAMVCGLLWAMFDWRFAVATFLTIGAYLAFTVGITEWRTKFRRAMNEMDGQANTKAIDSLLNYETVKYFGNEDHEARRYDAALAAYETAAIKSKASLSLLNVGQGLIIALGLIVIMTMAAQGIAAGHLTLGDFVLVNSYLIQLYLPLNMMGMVYREVKQSLIDMEQMFRLAEIEPAIEDMPGAEPLEPGPGAIEFDRVSFAYRPDRPILKDVSFRVPGGATVAIVGPSGAGKSTISRLLFRFYDVDEGAVRIDGQDVRGVAQGSVRAAIGIVPQDTVLFNDTIFYNIAYGRTGATPSEVEAAARLAKVHDFVMTMPDGYSTRVGERGLKLSGGEKQRVAIARTVLKAPRILLFDEATSALDTRTEREIQRSLDEVSRQRTTLVIAHRLSTIVDADEIVVLDAGRVVERGRHAELLARDGLYAAMWRRQQEAEDREEAAPAAVAAVGA